MSENQKTQQAEDRAADQPVGDRPTSNKTYHKPQIEKKRPLHRVTLFSGGGVSAGGLTTSG